MSFDGRPVSDPRDFRALSHPLRLRLLELLDEGPLTATEAAAVLDTTPANCSFHLRLLARHGFVTEAPGGTGRQRPWQLAEEGMSIVGRSLDDEGRRALQALMTIVDEQHRQRVLQWRRTRTEFPGPWQEAGGETFLITHLTAEELTELNAALREVLRPYVDRPRAQRAPGSVPIDIYLATIPHRRPMEGQHPMEGQRPMEGQ